MLGLISSMIIFSVHQRRSNRFERPIVWKKKTFPPLVMYLRYCPAFIESSELHYTYILLAINMHLLKDGYFLESLNILISTTTFCVCDNGFQGLSKAFHYPIPVLRIHYILGWIRIRGSMPLTNGSGFGSGSWIRILIFSSLTFKMPAKN